MAIGALGTGCIATQLLSTETQELGKSGYVTHGQMDSPLSRTDLLDINQTRSLSKFVQRLEDSLRVLKS